MWKVARRCFFDCLRVYAAAQRGELWAAAFLQAKKQIFQSTGDELACPTEQFYRLFGLRVVLSSTTC